MTDERRCTAKSKQTGNRCRRYPAPGCRVCVIHGAGNPAVRAAGLRRLQREHLRGDLGRLLAELEVDASEAHPVVQLTGALHRVWAMVSVLGALVGGLSTDESGPGALYGPDHLGDGRPHVLTEMYAQWLDRAARTSKLALDAGIEERAVRIEEERGRLIAEVFRSVFADAEVGLSADQRRAAAQVAARHLRAIESA
jgi:hypothetical protein